jgi:hypothetical protein
MLLVKRIQSHTHSVIIIYRQINDYGTATDCQFGITVIPEKWAQ